MASVDLRAISEDEIQMFDGLRRYLKLNNEVETGLKGLQKRAKVG